MASAVFVGAELSGFAVHGDDDVRHLASIRRPFSILVTRKEVISSPIPLGPDGFPNDLRVRLRRTGATQRTARKKVR